MTITFITHVHVRQENAAAYEAMMSNVRNMTRASEPGVVYYDFGKSADAPNLYMIVEVYRDRDAHAAHMQTEWVITSIPLARQFIEGKFDIKQYVSPGAEPAARQMRET